MNTTQLECFMEVSNYLNFSRAARQLGMTQPAVSHQINALEDELGVKLFQRSSRSVRLTQEGYIFLQFAGDILKLSRLSKVRVKGTAKAPVRLGIGCRNSAELQLLQPALQKMKNTAMDIMPVLRMVPADALENLLAEGDIRVLLSFEESAPKNASYRELFQCQVVCICAKDDPLAAHESLTVDQLKDAKYMAMCRPPLCPPAIFSAQNRVMAERGQGRVLFCDDLEVMDTLVASGYGFGLSVDFPIKRPEGVRCIPMPEFPKLSFGALYMKKEMTPAVKLFLEILGSCYAWAQDSSVQP